MPRPTLKVFKKRKSVFSGVRKPSLTSETPVADVQTNLPSSSRPRPSLDSPVSSKESASKRKVSGNLDDYDKITKKTQQLMIV